ncbi:hypothetical protein DFH07DRAFT_805674 [Mycena maculata]|uniref:Uncharacterized protein n=1 Tax=Mycena maculata TaxID=230809 RepID=A0AAD7JSF3_9AGAR|nr:hypothetical protein DFH07DRAFT_805674 [Mycena maculata]
MARNALESRWSAAEDELLIRAVHNFGDQDNWKTVALAVPGRTNKACRKRWLHSLSPVVKKSAWTQDEDRLLIELYTAHGPKWSAIARKIHGRTDDACSKRYREALDPNLKKDEWTPEEDIKLAEVYGRIGGKWGQVGQELRRSGLGCRNRWRMLERNRIKSTSTRAPEPMSTVTIAVFDETHFLHGEFPQDGSESLAHIWPVYYPPEAYPSVLGSESSHSFREPTPPQMPDSPEVPPFQFSSSSLSAALSDPPRTSLPLPPIPDSETVDYNQDEAESEPSASTSYSPAPPHAIPYEQHTVSPAELSIRHCRNSPIESCATHVSSLFADFPSPPASSSCSSPLWQSPSISSTDSLPLPDNSRPPGRTFDHTPMDTFFGPYSSSSSSSPFAPPASLSPSDSPIPCSPVELPPIEHFPAESLLFSSSYSYYHHLAPSKRQRKARMRKPPKSLGETRLSLLLPLSSDPNMRAYACGRYPCWPSGAEIGHQCFSTSKELLDHCRLVHGEQPEHTNDRPYRCALTGCGKSWKTLNGLQYHLQISAAHFRNAVSSTLKSADESDGPSTPAADADGGADTDAPGTRVYVCRHPQCFKTYKQSSGLRYHLRHGHPQDMPAQLETVPPTLAREITKKTQTKTQRMRPKDHSEDITIAL